MLSVQSPALPVARRWHSLMRGGHLSNLQKKIHQPFFRRAKWHMPYPVPPSRGSSPPPLAKRLRQHVPLRLFGAPAMMTGTVTGCTQHKAPPVSLCLLCRLYPFPLRAPRRRHVPLRFPGAGRRLPRPAVARGGRPARAGLPRHQRPPGKIVACHVLINVPYRLSVGYGAVVIIRGGRPAGVGVPLIYILITLMR